MTASNHVKASRMLVLEVVEVVLICGPITKCSRWDNEKLDPLVVTNTESVGL